MFFLFSQNIDVSIEMLFWVLITLADSVFVDARIVGRAKRQSNGEAPLDMTAAITCLIPGLRDLVCAGNRLSFDSSSPRNQARFIGVKNGVSIPLLSQIGVDALNGGIGQNYGATIGEGSIDFGTSDGLLGFFNRNKGGSFGWQPDGTFHVSGGESSHILNLFGAQNQTGFAVNPMAATGTLVKRTGLPGLFETKEEVVVDPLNLRLGGQIEHCILGICWQENKGFTV